MILLNDVSVKYGKKVALSHINLEIHSGQNLIIMGPNGSGKTTLLKAMLGLVKFEGDIQINGKSITSLSRNQIARHISYVPQIFSTPYSFTVKEFVSMGLYHKKRNWWDDEENVKEALKLTNIYDLKDKYINSISGGELQKCLIARALVQDSEFIAMDEPMSHLDVKAILEITSIISSFKDKGIIIVSHDVNIIRNIQGEFLFLKNGNAVYKGFENNDVFINALQTTFEVKAQRADGVYFFTRL